MGLLSSMGRLFGGAQDAVPTDPMDPRFWGGGTTLTTSGVAVTSDAAFGLDVVQSVLGRLSGTISTLPMMVFKRNADGSKEAAPDHPLYILLHRRPNRFQTAQEFRSELVSHLAFWRNAYSLIHPGLDGEAIGELEQIHPSRLKSITQTGGRRFYTFNRLNGGGQDTYRDDQIWHIRMGPLTKDGLRGQYVFETAKETFGRAIAVENFGAQYFANGGSGGGTIVHPGTFKTKEEKDLFLEAWRSSSTGSNRHKDKLLLNGVTYTRDAVNNDEAQFLETLKEVAMKVCRLWNMPPHMAGILSQATFNNMEQQSTEYVVYTLAPYIVGIEQAAWRDLLIGSDQDEYFVEFNVAGLLRGDFKTRMQGYAQGRQWGWLSANDIRDLESQPRIGPGGDQYLVPLNMGPAGAAAGDSSIGHNGG
ncbi:MAG: phage portal protein, partial [Caulobacteraceae bacterium]